MESTSGVLYPPGGRIDTIRREHYRSILAAEGMKEVPGRIDSALLFAIGGEQAHARDQFAGNRPRSERSLKAERDNATLPGEQKRVVRLTALRAG